jgi:hypothetical protein
MGISSQILLQPIDRALKIISLMRRNLNYSQNKIFNQYSQFQQFKLERAGDNIISFRNLLN